MDVPCRGHCRYQMERLCRLLATSRIRAIYQISGRHLSLRKPGDAKVRRHVPLLRSYGTAGRTNSDGHHIRRKL